MKIEQIRDDDKKKEATRAVLEALPEWFGIPEAREENIEKSAGRLFWCAYEDGQAVGFLYLNETGKATAELYVMGILKAYQRKGIGRLLFDAAKETAREQGYSFIQVKTVQMGKKIQLSGKNTIKFTKTEFFFE